MITTPKQSNAEREAEAEAMAIKHGFSLGAVNSKGEDIPEARSFVPNEIARECYLAGAASARKDTEVLVLRLESMLARWDNVEAQKSVSYNLLRDALNQYRGNNV